MNLSDLYTCVKKDELKPVYLLCGTGELLISEFIDFLVRTFQGKDSSGMNTRLLNADEIGGAIRLVEDACIPPYFLEKKLLIVKGVDNWPEKEQKILLSYIKKPASWSVLFLVGRDPKKLGLISRDLERNNTVIIANSPKDRELPKWIKSRLSARGKTITPTAIGHLLELVGNDMREISNALKKLEAYVGAKSKIELLDVSAALDDIRTKSVFELTDSIGSRQLLPALGAMRKLLQSGESPLMVLSMLGRQLRLILGTKSAAKTRHDVGEIAKHVGQPRWLANKLLGQSKKFTQEELKVYIDLVYEIDKKIKSTTILPELYLEWLIVTICEGLAGSKSGAYQAFRRPDFIF